MNLSEPRDDWNDEAYEDEFDADDVDDASVEEDDDESETVPCPECGRPVYEDAEQCPHCGNYITARVRGAERSTWWWIAFALALATAFAWAVFH